MYKEMTSLTDNWITRNMLLLLVSYHNCSLSF